MIYVILGMHKSGTTLISQILHNSEINMIDKFDSNISYDKGNKYERESTKNINQEILGSKGVFSLDIKIPQTLQAKSIQKKQIQKIIQSCDSKYEHWGFKDPRTCLTYPIWASELPEHKVIVIYRSPHEIWQRYLKSRKKYTSNRYAYLQGTWEFMESWCNYNNRIINYLKNSNRSFLVLNYKKFMTEEFEFRRLEKFVGHKIVDCRNANLYRNNRLNLYKLISAFCFVKTLNFPNKIYRKLESLNYD